MSVADSLIAAVETALRGIVQGTQIRITEGYPLYTCQRTIKTAERWRQHPFLPADLPAWSIEDSEVKNTLEGMSPPLQGHLVSYELFLYVGGAIPESVVRQHIEDARACIGLNQRWGGLAQRTLITGHNIKVQTRAEPYAAAKLTMDIFYRTRLFEM